MKSLKEIKRAYYGFSLKVVSSVAQLVKENTNGFVRFYAQNVFSCLSDPRLLDAIVEHTVLFIPTAEYYRVAMQVGLESASSNLESI